MNIPEFIIFTGPMFGSKTTNLLGAIDRYRYQNKNVITFKPKLDDRYDISKIVTHNGGSVAAHVIQHGNDIMDFIQAHPEKIDVIAVVFPTIPFEFPLLVHWAAVLGSRIPEFRHS